MKTDALSEARDATGRSGPAHSSLARGLTSAFSCCDFQQKLAGSGIELGTKMSQTQHAATLTTFESLKLGNTVELQHDVKVGFRSWTSTTIGKVVRAERRRSGLHRARNFDDKVYSDVIVLQREDGELTTVTLDEFTRLWVID